MTFMSPGPGTVGVPDPGIGNTRPSSAQAQTVYMEPLTQRLEEDKAPCGIPAHRRRVFT